MSDQNQRSGADAPPVERSSIRKNAFHMLSSQSVTWVFATVIAVLVPRYLGPAIAGQYRLATSLWLIGSIFIGLGTSRYLEVEIARSSDRGLRLVGSVVVLRVFAFCAVSLGLLGYLRLTSADTTLVLLVVVFGLGILATQVAEPMSSGFIGLERMSVPATQAVLTRVLGAAGMLLLIALGASAYALAGATVAATLVAGVYVAVRFTRLTRLSLSGWRDRIPNIVKLSVPFMAVGTALIVYQQIDIVVISWRASEEDLGWYGTAEGFFGSLLFPTTILMVVLFPSLGRTYLHDPPRFRSLVDHAFNLLLVVSVPLGLGIALIGPSLARFLWGDAFGGAGEALVVLGPVAILTSGTIVFGTVAMATGRTWTWSVVIFLAAAVTVPLDLVLVPWASDRYGNGAIGGALAYLITEGLQFVAGGVLIVGFLWNRDLVLRSLRVLLAGAAMVAIGLPFRDGPFWLTIAVCAPVYVLAIFVLRVLRDEERAMLGNAVARVGIRRGRVRR